MPDLISREYVLTEYDRQHQGPPGGARKIMEEAPAIDAIPVEWIRSLMLDGWPDDSKAAWRVLKAWKEEQEAR